jgi:hypothetical protein
MLVDREAQDRENRRLHRYLKAARLRANASVEDLDFHRPRGLDRSVVLPGRRPAHDHYQHARMSEQHASSRCDPRSRTYRPRPGLLGALHPHSQSLPSIEFEVKRFETRTRLLRLNFPIGILAGRAGGSAQPDLRGRWLHCHLLLRCAQRFDVRRRFNLVGQHAVFGSGRLLPIKKRSKLFDSAH